MLKSNLFSRLVTVGVGLSIAVKLHISCAFVDIGLLGCWAADRILTLLLLMSIILP